jgi:hypothetical protein
VVQSGADGQGAAAVILGLVLEGGDDALKLCAYGGAISQSAVRAGELNTGPHPVGDVEVEGGACACAAHGAVTADAFGDRGVAVVEPGFWIAVVAQPGSGCEALLGHL